ncbi:MAG TPA: protein phosphatase 2C domain-containing protein [Vitreimonas sp.]|uniref:protein phosphatase 2C domain-containing protein n=1 Tax=Vitreimonas sp. TaxID=3069702 RepID=UPI002D39C553|nr:protein phosphatase 2C domain-containing protein [Vitreimonas sp.]HYD87991.1 protein phosphatase 2C domain-containing protein [Vitreimonas sp.]
MLTLVESISLAGDRAKQNDDACGQSHGVAWVIDGATDLHETPLTQTASDASWLAHTLDTALHAYAYPGSGSEAALRSQLARVMQELIAPLFEELIEGQEIERWQRPIASLLMLGETPDGVDGIDLGDCRLAAVDASGASVLIGGPDDAADAETRLAAQQTDADKPLLRREGTIARLRDMRAALNQEGAHWTVCLDAACASHARGWRISLQRPAHLLLMTDGFSALIDRYHSYDAAGLVKAALGKGLQELGRELRAIETADAGGAKHPRFKPSDDATALLLRLS